MESLRLARALLDGFDLVRFARGTDPSTGTYGYYNVDIAQAVLMDRYRRRFGIPSVFA